MVPLTPAETLVIKTESFWVQGFPETQAKQGLWAEYEVRYIAQMCSKMKTIKATVLVRDSFRIKLFNCFIILCSYSKLKQAFNKLDKLTRHYCNALYQNGTMHFKLWM